MRINAIKVTPKLTVAFLLPRYILLSPVNINGDNKVGKDYVYLATLQIKLPIKLQIDNVDFG